MKNTLVNAEQQTLIRQKANKSLWVSGSLVATITLVFSGLWLNVYQVSESSPDATTSILTLLRLTPDRDPFGAISAFGTMAIAIAVGMLDSSRRLESLDQRSKSSPDFDEQKEILHQIHRSQVVNLVEFFLTTFAASFALFTTVTLGVGGESTLSIISGFLLVLLLLAAWKFLLAFDSLSRVISLPPSERIADRLNRLSRPNSIRKVASLLYSAVFVAIYVTISAYSISHTNAVDGGAVAIALLVCTTQLAAWGFTVAARTAVFEYGSSRAITIGMLVLSQAVFSVVFPLLLVFSPPTLAGQDLFSGILLACLNGSFFTIRTLDQSALFPRYSTFGLTLNKILQRPNLTPGSLFAQESRLAQVFGILLTAVLISLFMTPISTEPLEGFAAMMVAISVAGGCVTLITMKARWAPNPTRFLMHCVSIFALLAVYILIALLASPVSFAHQWLPTAASLTWLGGVAAPLLGIILSPQTVRNRLTDSTDRRHARRGVKLRRKLGILKINCATVSEGNEYRFTARASKYPQ